MLALLAIKSFSPSPLLQLFGIGYYRLKLTHDPISHIILVYRLPAILISIASIAAILNHIIQPPPFRSSSSSLSSYVYIHYHPYYFWFLSPRVMPKSSQSNFSHFAHYLNHDYATSYLLVSYSIFSHHSTHTLKHPDLHHTNSCSVFLSTALYSKQYNIVDLNTLL